MTEEEIDKQINALAAEKRKLQKDKEISQYGEWATQIKEKGDVNFGEFFNDINYGSMPETLHYSISWYDRPKCIDKFIYGGLIYEDDHHDYDRYVYFFKISKQNGERFTIEELIKIVPNLKKEIEERIEKMKDSLENLENIVKQIG